MKIFITGSTGFIGKNLIKKLKKHTLYLYKKGENLDTSLKKFQPTHIIHLAGEIYNEAIMFKSNVLLTYELLIHSASIPYKSFVYVGSSSEYGRKKEPIKETDFLDPINFYEATKGCGTLLCQAASKRFLKPISIARPFSVYGKYEPDHRLIPVAINAVKKGNAITIFRGSHDYIHVDDFINGIILLLKKPTQGEIFNFGTGIQFTNLEVVEKIENIFGKTTKKNIVNQMGRKYDSDNWIADNSKALKLGWRVTKTLSEGLSELI